MQTEAPSKGRLLNDGVLKREVFGWALYDFANSGYTTVVLTAVFNAYFVSVVADGAAWGTLAWTLAVAASSLIAMLTLPALGAHADRYAAKKRLLGFCTVACVVATAALAEALKVAHVNLDDKEALAGLSLLSTLGMITADANHSVVPTPRPLLLRIARYLDGAATSVTDGANLPDGLDDTHRQQFADVLAQDADGIRALANTEDGDPPRLWRTPNPR